MYIRMRVEVRIFIFFNRIKEFGFTKSEDEPCIYVRTGGSVVVFLFFYVGDILLVGMGNPSLESINLG